MSLRRDPDISDLGCHCNTSWCGLFFSADFTRNQQWRTNFSRRWVKCGRSYEEAQEYIKLRVDLKSYLWSLLYDASCKFHNMHCAWCLLSRDVYFACVMTSNTFVVCITQFVLCEKPCVHRVKWFSLVAWQEQRYSCPVFSSPKPSYSNLPR